MNARKAVFAGSWYPRDAAACEREINAFLDEAGDMSVPKRDIVGGIVPHAGWFFSGSIACNVIRHLSYQDPPDVIVVFGMHLHPESPCHIMAEGAWETPFGEIQIEQGLADALVKRFSFNIETAQSFARDNTIELQIPFIRHFFKDVRIVPIGVAPAETSLDIGRAVVDISNQLGLRVKVVGSTDLTHYGSNYGFTSKGTGAAALRWMRENDQRVIDTMIDMDPPGIIREALANHNACCPGAAATAIAAGKQLGAEHAEFLTYATSYDKHPGDSFVGYAGIIF